MPSKKEVEEKARNFLEAVSKEVQGKVNIKVVQTGMWWSTAGPGDSMVVVQAPGPTIMSQSGSHQREVFNSFGVGAHYQTQLWGDGFPEQTELHAAISAAGIDAQWIPMGFLLPLLYAWCELPEPLDLSHSAAQELLERFSNAVVEHRSTTTYRDAVVYVDLGGEPVALEEGIVLRPISEDELYELSQEKFPSEPYIIQFSPSDKWSMLEIQIEHPFEDGPSIWGSIRRMRDAIIAGIALARVGHFILLPVGMTTNFGTNATGASFRESRLPREFGGPFPKIPTALSADTRNELADMWPIVREVMMADSHYLALPLRRLVDGLGRTRLDDRIIDYAIGLEALLTEGERAELGYRFALRGATILEEGGADKQQAFNELKELYNARSAIVHGASISKFNLGIIIPIPSDGVIKNLDII